MRRLLNAALDTARMKGANTNKAVAAGYCFGGAAVLEMARSGADLQGFVTFHGGLATPEGQNYSTAKGKVVVFGEAAMFTTQKVGKIKMGMNSKAATENLQFLRNIIHWLDKDVQ